LSDSLLIDNLEVCRLLGVKPDTWRKRVRAGTAPVPHTTMGARTYYRRADVRHYARHGTWPSRVVFMARETSAG
jgi:predicted site-specific integrase-resolvase